VPQQLANMSMALPEEGEGEKTALDEGSVITVVRCLLSGETDAQREAAGCTLWDLTASRPTSESLVRRQCCCMHTHARAMQVCLCACGCV
jgi:hypothetical protein